ncbi:adenosylmethionine decarboxylase [Metabacillus litoralis]|jgi:spermidine synthase|uniref:adenosylmethionine decarboxylase n=1 Tax=Metabacillus litoralis TaxID=152268 RepID=UPI00203EE693|nr:adenosylmethionine decarboxylase [Metabacillus litoralis]MCM3652229.1 adenosylmethionine decarboxylase [Metabacillus litoralis]
MDMRGQHFIIDAYECSEDILNNAEQLKELLTKAINQLGMEILSTHFHSFSPQGVTGVIGISTSHVSIHTWPEHGYAALDLYTCGNQDIWPALKAILEKIEAKRTNVYELSRGEESNNKPVMKKINLTSNASIEKNIESRSLFQLRDDRGNEWDMKQLKEMIVGKHNILYHGASEFQDILLVEANDLRLYIDQELQFCSLDERHYHEALVYPVMEVAASNERVLILGGGDGLALREVLKYPDVKHVDLVDIDPMIIELAKTNPSLLAQNNRSFLDSRVHVHIKDAKKYLAGELQQYNVIIIDFPDPVNSILSSLYTKELFSKVANLLSEDGALVCQSNSPEDAPQVFWSIGKTIKRTGLYTKGYNVIVPSFGLWGFHLATHEKISGKIPNISVPHQALPTNMETMFEIPSSIKEEQENAFVNTETQLKLHDLYQKEIKDLY